LSLIGEAALARFEGTRFVRAPARDEARRIAADVAKLPPKAATALRVLIFMGVLSLGLGFPRWEPQSQSPSRYIPCFFRVAAAFRADLLRSAAMGCLAQLRPIRLSHIDAKMLGRLFDIGKGQCAIFVWNTYYLIETRNCVSDVTGIG
jgi:hypothetical protein